MNAQISPYFARWYRASTIAEFLRDVATCFVTVLSRWPIPFGRQGLAARPLNVHSLPRGGSGIDWIHGQGSLTAPKP